MRTKSRKCRVCSGGERFGLRIVPVHSAWWPSVRRGATVDWLAAFLFFWSTTVLLINPVHGQDARATAVDWERLPLIRSQTMHIHYRISSVQPNELGRVELWYRRGMEGLWQLYTYDEDRTSPVVFTAQQDGLYQFLVVAVDRWERRSLSDRSDGGGGRDVNRGGAPEPHVTVFVDYTRPQLYLYSPRPDGSGIRSYQGQTLPIRWGGFDANLSARPVLLYYRREKSDTWVPISGPQKAEGEYVWQIPEQLSGPVMVRAVLQDRVGNMDVQDSGWITIMPHTSETQVGPEGIPVDEAAVQGLSGEPGQGNVISGELPGKSGKSEEADRYFRSGLWYSQRREWDKAAAAFEKVLELAPGSVEGRINLANALYARGNFEGALEHYEQVLQADPKRPNALFNLVQTQIALKQYDKSLATVDRVLEQDKQDWQAWLVRGQAAQELGRRKVARESWQHVAYAGPPYFSRQAQELLNQYRP